MKGLMLFDLVAFTQAFRVDTMSCGCKFTMSCTLCRPTLKFKIEAKGLSLRLQNSVEEAYSMADLAVQTMESDAQTKAFASLLFKDDQCIAQAKGLSL